MTIRYKIRQFHRNNLALGYYPGTRRSCLIFVFLFTLVSSYFNPSLILWVKPYLDGILDTNDPSNDVVVHGLVGLIFWVILATIRKLILRRVLTYRGWMYERTPSLKTKLFAITVRLLCGWFKPLSSSLYDLQNILPALPVPSLKESISQYLGSMKPLVEAAKYLELEARAKEFMQFTGPRLQRYLYLKSWLAPNYISDWWEDYIYLKGRSSLLIDSNYYAVDALAETTQDQATRAALLTYSTLLTRKAIEENKLEPIIANGVIPLCSWQLERMFNTSRIPGESMDHLQHEEFSDHVVVQHRGRYFRVEVYHDKRRTRLLSPAEFRIQFSRILNDDESKPVNGEDKLAALTTGNRTDWARTRKLYFSQGVNKVSLDIIEKSAFLINLDDAEYLTECLKHPGKTTPDYSEFNRQLLHGNGCNRWMDKSFNFIVSKNGRAGGLGEHSWGDAPVGAYMWEQNLRYGLEFDQFDENGLIRTPPEKIPACPTRLKWDLSEECLEDIDVAAKEAWRAIENLDLKMIVFSAFGKGLMKKCKVSPDAFIQMALQLAYFRDQGKFNLTYEASMTRFYLQGRTETVRSCTTESCEWVMSMQNNLPREECIKLFQTACNRHQNSYRLSMSGKGFDRHLFGLYVISKYLKVDSAFLNEALSEPWRLSTSQTPTHQTKGKALMILGGGFGPVASDGYGISYIIGGEDLLFFHITSKKAASNTDTSKFGNEIERALQDIRELFEV